MTFAFYLVPERTNNLYLRISHGKERSTHATGVTMPPDDFDTEENLPKDGSPYHHHARLLLEKLDEKNRELTFQKADVFALIKKLATFWLTNGLAKFPSRWFNEIPNDDGPSFEDLMKAAGLVFPDRDIQVIALEESYIVISENNVHYVVTSRPNHKQLIRKLLCDETLAHEEVGFCVRSEGLHRAWEKSGLTALAVITDAYAEYRADFDTGNTSLIGKEEAKRQQKSQFEYLLMLATLSQSYPLPDVVERLDRDFSTGMLARAISKVDGVTPFLDDYLTGMDTHESVYKVALQDDEEDEETIFYLFMTRHYA